MLLPFIADFWDVHHAEFSLETCRGILRDWTKAENCFFVIMRDDAAVGFLRTHNSSPTVCWIDDIYVDAAQRGQGIASEAIRQMEKRLLTDGCRSFCMEVVPDNLPAMRLYHRLGYDRLSVITMRKDYDEFETERVEHIASLPMRVRHFDCRGKSIIRKEIRRRLFQNDVPTAIARMDGMRSFVSLLPAFRLARMFVFA